MVVLYFCEEIVDLINMWSFGTIAEMWACLQIPLFHIFACSLWPFAGIPHPFNTNLLLFIQPKQEALHLDLCTSYLSDLGSLNWLDTSMLNARIWSKYSIHMTSLVAGYPSSHAPQVKHWLRSKPACYLACLHWTIKWHWQTSVVKLCETISQSCCKN